jgi:hypothetical protein
MWHTSLGDRTLRGDEAALVGTAIDTMIEALMIHIDDSLDDSFEDALAADCQSGIAVYDSLSACQRVGVLHDVARHLLTETESTLPLSAATEATVAAVFVEIRDQVAIEIDLFPDVASKGNRPTWRARVLAAQATISHTSEGGHGGVHDGSEQLAEEMELPAETSTDMAWWEGLISGLCDAVLWDRDFEMAESFLDVDPGVSQQRRRLLGIDDDYFTRVGPDPRPSEVFELVSRTREIVRAKPR